MLLVLVILLIVIFIQSIFIVDLLAKQRVLRRRIGVLRLVLRKISPLSEDEKYSIQTLIDVN